jgi:hypothetical protein
MDRRNVLSLSAITALGLALLSDNALAQQTADVEGVKAASKAFYAALAALDNGASMEKVWAHTPYVTYVGPRAKTIIVGWDAQKKYWVDTDPTVLAEKRHVVRPAYSRQWQPGVGDGSGERDTKNERRQRCQGRLHRHKRLRES